MDVNLKKLNSLKYYIKVLCFG